MQHELVVKKYKRACNLHDVCHSNMKSIQNHSTVTNPTMGPYCIVLPLTLLWRIACKSQVLYTSMNTAQLTLKNCASIWTNDPYLYNLLKMMIFCAKNKLSIDYPFLMHCVIEKVQICCSFSPLFYPTMHQKGIINGSAIKLMGLTICSYPIIEYGGQYTGTFNSQF